MSKTYQFYTAFAACFPSILVGLLNVWPSYTLSLYTSQNTTLLTSPMNEYHSSFLGSLPALGGMVGTGLVGPLIDRIGRKKGGIVLFIPFVLTWAAIEFSKSTLVILCARFFCGLSAGGSLVYAAIFISEIAEDSVRGALASGTVMFYCVGILISYLLGWFLSYHTIIWINMAASVICLLLIGTVMESPVFLLKNNREEEARAALAHYRGVSPASKTVLEELARLKQQTIPAVELVPITDDAEKPDETEKEKLQAEEPDIVDEIEKMPSWKLLFVSPSSRRAFIVVGFLISSQVLMGMIPVQVYAKELFVKAAPNLSSHLCSVLFAIVLLGGSLVTTLITDRAGRRSLIIISSVMVGITLACLAFLLQTSIAPPWVSAVTLLLYCFSFYCGVGSVPYVLLAEVFVSEVQSIASMLLVEWVWFLNFFILAVFPFLSNMLGIHIVFYMFASMGFLNAVVSYFIVPETKGLSTQQIQEALLRRRGDEKLY